MRSLFSMGSSNKDIILVRIFWDSLKVETYRFSGQKYVVLSAPFYLVDRLPELIDQFVDL
ncbi:MAG TPA: hypothetical protein DCP02_05415 [Actinobacteria bacterium]|nr:hypothetical protein [Actinomycetota bacterium]